MRERPAIDLARERAKTEQFRRIADDVSAELKAVRRNFASSERHERPPVPLPTGDDAPRRRRRGPPMRRLKTARAEQQYFSGLAAMADHVTRMIRAYPDIQTEGANELAELLQAYAQALKPWARRHASRMLMDVNARDIDTWRSLMKDVGQQLRHDIRNTPVGHLMAERLREQVSLITSLPMDAGERVVKLTQEALVNGVRSTELIEKVLQGGEITYNRAKLIARTEVAKTASVLQEARAREAGSTHYRWQTAMDSTVRPGHMAMQGKVCAWDNPPEVMEGKRLMRHHPGRIWACRCWPEAILEQI